MAKARAQKQKKSEPSLPGFILPQGNMGSRGQHRSYRGGPGERKLSTSKSPVAFMLVGMRDSLGKTFTTYEGAAKYAAEHGLFVKVQKPRAKKTA